MKEMFGTYYVCTRTHRERRSYEFLHLNTYSMNFL